VIRSKYEVRSHAALDSPEEGQDGVAIGDALGDVVVPPPPAGAGDVTVVVVDGAVDVPVPNQFHRVNPKKSRMSTISARIAAPIPAPAPEVVDSVSTTSEPAGLQ
jgi:hypothetical protein